MMSIEQRLEIATEYLCTQLKLDAPKDTWNLTINAIRILPNEHTIVIGGEIAPYAVFTNEAWKEGSTWTVTRDKLFGKKVDPYEVTMTRRSKNPNEGWINKAIEKCIPMIQSLLTGTYTQEELDAVLDGIAKNEMLTYQRRFTLAELKEAQARALEGGLK